MNRHTGQRQIIISYFNAVSMRIAVPSNPPLHFLIQMLNLSVDLIIAWITVASFQKSSHCHSHYLPGRHAICVFVSPLYETYHKTK